METYYFLKIRTIIVVFSISFFILFGGINAAQAQRPPGWPILICRDFYYDSLPDSLCYIYPGYYTNYGYFNTINGGLLGFTPFTPFLNQYMSTLYHLNGIPTYPYFGSPYQGSFPYTPLTNAIIPYKRFEYPTYGYGSPGFYLSWVLMQ